TTVMTAVELKHAGIASGVNNAVSRIAGLLAVAAFGLVLTNIFNQNLNLRLNSLQVSATTPRRIEIQRSRLAAIETDDILVRNAVNGSFIAGYQAVVWTAAALSIASSLSALVLIQKRNGLPSATS